MSAFDPHRFYSPDVEVFSIASSSNATQSDLPGPGRNLGNLYSFLGKHLEGFLNGLAERKGLGPNAVAARIKKRDYDRDRYKWMPVEYTKKEATEQKRDIKKLIKYTKSRTESTRQQALENIIDFAWRGEHFRNLLKALNAAQVIKVQEPYIWDYCDPSVQISSRLALVCVEEDRLFRSERSLAPWSKFDALKEYMRLNPEQSFLVLRLFTRYMEELALSAILTEVETLISTSPEQVEWEEVDKVYEYWFRERLWPHGIGWLPLLSGPLVFEPFRRICLSAQNLPRTIQSSLFHSWIRGLEDPKDVVPHLQLENLLQSAEAENMSREKALIFLSPFTQALDEADIVMCGMLAPFIIDLGFDLVRIAVCTEAITSGCVKLAEFINSGVQRVAQRAFVCCRVVLMMGIYPRTQMLKSLASTAFAGCTEYVQLIDVTGRKCRPSGRYEECYLWRHCDDQGHLIHLEDDGSCCMDACSSEHRLSLDRQGVMGFELKRGDLVTAPSGVVPILAGQYSDGRRALLCRSRRFAFKYVAVAEGTEAEFELTLFTLRYALDTYSGPHGPGEFVASEDQCLDATGPYSWKFYRYLTRDSILWTD